MSPNISVILSTYNSPDWLEKALWGYYAQTDRNFEIVVADDGSRDETRRRIENIRRDTGLALDHVWHPDDGFRKCAILNRAIVASRGNYLIFTDGDCVPRADFVSVHRRFARQGRFLSGGLLRLPMKASLEIDREDILSGRAMDAAWLHERGLPRVIQSLKLRAGGLSAALLDRFTPTIASWNGHNASGWKTDLLAVNGFDERMEYGGEDRELGERLENHGIRGFRVRYRAICVHLEHARGYVNEEAWKANQAIREETRRTRADWTHYGIVHTHEDRRAA